MTYMFAYKVLINIRIVYPVVYYVWIILHSPKDVFGIHVKCILFFL